MPGDREERLGALGALLPSTLVGLLPPSSPLPFWPADVLGPAARPGAAPASPLVRAAASAGRCGFPQGRALSPRAAEGRPGQARPATQPAARPRSRRETPPSPRARARAHPQEQKAVPVLPLMGLAPLKAVCEGIVCSRSKRNIIQRPFRPQKKRQSRVIIGDSPLTRASLLFVCVGLIRATNGAGGGAR